MQVLLLTLLPILSAIPVWTHFLYRTCYDWEKRQIGLDNAAIVLGRADRELFSELQKTNGTIDKIEISHHKAHACAATDPKCRVADAILEQWISVIHGLAYESAALKWKMALSSARDEFARLSPTWLNSDRNPTVPIVERICSLCGVNAYWEILKNQLPLVTNLQSLGVEVAVKMEGSSLSAAMPWQYSLRQRR